jgi:predicted GTPase
LKLIESALNREFLKYIIILIDARRGFMDSDKILLDNIYNKTNAEIILVSTKNDKREAKDLVSDKFKIFKISNTKKHNIKDIQRYLKL